ncbi:MAG TPA: DUF554 domain-containing protein [bacterium]|nr:DUF554 domain-containing protein [bacterium]
MIVGTLINMVTVTVGSLTGTVVGNRLSVSIQKSVLHVLGLFTLYIGFKYALKSENVLIPLGALLLGTIMGETIGIQRRLDGIGIWFEKRFRLEQSRGNVSRGFIVASLVFCVGPLTILGCIQDGLSGDYQLLALKSTLDAFSSMALAAGLGIGVFFAGLTVLVYQGLLSLFASTLSGVLTDPMIAEMTSAGGIMLIGNGLLLLEIKELPIANYLPALVIAPVIVAVVG